MKVKISKFCKALGGLYYIGTSVHRCYHCLWKISKDKIYKPTAYTHCVLLFKDMGKGSEIELNKDIKEYFELNDRQWEYILSEIINKRILDSETD